MGIVQVHQLKPGCRMLEDVFTASGRLLFTKGKFISPREIEILQAFLIKTVVTDSPEAQETEGAEEENAQSANFFESLFYKEYEKMLRLIKQIISNSGSGASLPILDIRRQIVNLLEHIDEYNVLTFVPKEMKVEEYLYHHSIKVSLTAYQLAKWNGFPQKDLIPVALAGLLHDIGNVKVDADILMKKDRLSSSEIEEIRQHTLNGYQILKHVQVVNEGVRMAALQHHEREDGSGYPHGANAHNIHVYAKIVAIADTFHAMTSKHAYKEAVSPYVALEQLSTEAFGKLEPKFVQNFVSKVTQFHNGTLVRLSNNRVGEIVFSDHSHPTRPWVKIDGNIINLALNRSLYIEEVITS